MRRLYVKVKAAASNFIPVQIQNVTAVDSFGSVRINWDELAEYNITVYEVWKKVGTGAYILLTEIPFDTYGMFTVDTDVEAGNTYTYRVQAKNAEGKYTDWSNEASITLEETVPTYQRNFQRTFTVNNGTHAGMEVLVDFYVPQALIDNPTQTDFPVVFWGHGQGESGFDIATLRSGAGYPKFISQGDDYPYIIVSAQRRIGDGDLELYNEVIAFAKTIIPAINVNAIGVAGWSAGKMVYWYLESERAKIKVAIACALAAGLASPYCPYIDDGRRVWLIGADNDPMGKGGHLTFFNAMKNCGEYDATKHKMTLYTTGGHDVVTRSLKPSASGGAIVSGNNYSTLQGNDVHNFIMAAWDEEAPSVPTGLSLVEKTGLKATVKWNASTDEYAGIRGYVVNIDGVDEDETTDLSFTKFELSPSTQYGFKVKAIDNNGNESGYSSVLNVTTDEISDPLWNPDMTSSDARITTSDSSGYTKSGSTLTGVADKSSRGGNTINIGNSPAIVLGSGGKEAIHFRKTNSEKLSIPHAAYFNYVDSQLIFAVAKIDFSASDQWTGVVAKGDNGHDIRRYGATNEICSDITGLSPATIGRTNINNTDYQILVSNIKDGKRQFRVNGVLKQEVIDITQSLPINSFPIGIASTEDKSRFTEMVLHEVVVGKGKDLTTIEKYEGWAAHEYGLTSLLPSSHPYKTVSPPSV